MAGFSEPLDPATPAGGSPISSGDDSIRQFKRAILERLATLITDVNVNPWSIKTAAAAPAGPSASQQMVVHAAAGGFAASVGTSNPPPYVAVGSFGEVYNPQATDGMGISISIPLPGSTGGSIVTITRVEMVGQRDDASVMMRFTPKIVTAAGAPAAGPAINIVGTGTQTADSGNLNMPVPQGGSFMVYVEVGPAPVGTTFVRFVRVTYDLG